MQRESERLEEGACGHPGQRRMSPEDWGVFMMAGRRFRAAARRGLWGCVLAGWLVGPSPAPAADAEVLLPRAELRSFIETMTIRHGFDQDALERLFSRIAPRPEVLEAIAQPAEARPWPEYRALLLTAARVEGGVTFWEEHAPVLARASTVSGVPSEVIVAILGIESSYGQNTGRHPVLETLVTLAFAYPPRASFFRKELEEYLLFTREEDLDPLVLKGSYAGAMGPGQFISSSYRRFAVDFDDDGRRDLLHNMEDVIGSVAHYLQVHGWRAGDGVASPVEAGGQQAVALPASALALCAPQSGKGQAPADGASGLTTPPRSLLILERGADREYWMIGPNFCVITCYNQSLLYAMAVHQLSQEILAARRQAEATQP